MKRLNKKGFTIVELVIVIAVIAILAGVLIPTFATVVDKANQSKAMQEAKNAYEMYLAEYAETGKNLQNLCIKSGKYYFYVNNGSFDSTAYDKVDSNKATYKTIKVADKGGFETKAVSSESNGVTWYEPDFKESSSNNSNNG